MRGFYIPLYNADTKVEMTNGRTRLAMGQRGKQMGISMDHVFNVSPWGGGGVRRPVSDGEGSSSTATSLWFHICRWLMHLHIQIPPDLLRRSHVTKCCWGYCKFEYLWGYFEGTLQLLWQEFLACSSCRVPTTYETYVASQEESGCVQ